MTQVFIVSTSLSVQSFTCPPDWDPVNGVIECIGNGGRGGTGLSSPAGGGGGGGGGSYAKNNTGIVLPASVPFWNYPGGSGNWTTFNNATAGASTPGTVWASGGGQGGNASP